MKMKKNLVALCLSAGLFASLPAISLAETAVIPQHISAAPSVPGNALARLTWTPVDLSKTHTTVLTSIGQTLNAGDIRGPVAAYRIPANSGELTITLVSEVKKQQVFSPGVMVFDQNMVLSAFFPAEYFTYQPPGVMSEDRLEGVMKLTPAPGQQYIYLLVFTRDQDLQRTTTLLDPAKAYAKGVGNAVPDIPDPVARHVTDGTLKLKVKTNSGSSILVGPMFGSAEPAPVPVGNIVSPVYSAAPAASVPSAKSVPVSDAKRQPVLSDTEQYFNKAIKQAVARGDIDKALKLLDEAERLGSVSARTTFISSVKGKG